ncbi:MAG: hypothetical protein ABFD16_00605 [Thermoguttaceae bacterium]|jgi:chemotaxis protein CheC
MSLGIGSSEAVRELVEAGIRQAIVTLQDLCGAPIEYTTPQVVQGRPQEAESLLPPDQATGDRLVLLDFEGGLTGRGILALPDSSGDKLVALLERIIGRSDTAGPQRDGLLAEVGNLLLNGLLGSIANTLNISIVAPVPQVVAGSNVPELLRSHRTVTKNPDQEVFLAVTPLHIDQHAIHGEVILLFEATSLQRLLTPAS